jgi:hypothetical protein
MAPRRIWAVLVLIAAVPVLVVVRIALVSVIVVVRVGVHLVAPFYVRGLGLDVPGEGVVITAVRPVDEWPGRLRSDGLAGRRFGVHGGSEKSQCERPSMGRWAPIWPMMTGSPGLRGWTT